jgi:sRNA-binding carbon storage regulator CsrA
LEIFKAGVVLNFLGSVNITVEIVKIQGNRIALGIVAPSNVKILLGEFTEQQAEAQMVELVVEDGLLVAC